MSDSFGWRRISPTSSFWRSAISLLMRLRVVCEEGGGVGELSVALGESAGRSEAKAMGVVE